MELYSNNDKVIKVSLTAECRHLNFSCVHSRYNIYVHLLIMEGKPSHFSSRHSHESMQENEVTVCVTNRWN